MEPTHESNLMMAIVQAQDADIAQHALKSIKVVYRNFKTKDRPGLVDPLTYYLARCT